MDVDRVLFWGRLITMITKITMITMVMVKIIITKKTQLGIMISWFLNLPHFFQWF